MATLIGWGSHGTDIWVTIKGSKKPRWERAAHHTSYQPDGTPYIIGINNPWERQRVADLIGERDIPWVHPNAYIGPCCEYGYGTHVNYGVTMTRTTLGNYVTVSPGVTICGDVTVGDRVLIGAGATICDRVTIGDDVTIGAGAVVLPEKVVPDGETWVGVPARVRA